MSKLKMKISKELATEIKANARKWAKKEQDSASKLLTTAPAAVKQ